MSFFSNLFGATGAPGQGGGAPPPPAAQQRGPRPTGGAPPPQRPSVGGAPGAPGVARGGMGEESGGGFFNLPTASQPHAGAAGGAVAFGGTSLGPGGGGFGAPPAGGADLFGALALKPTASASSNAAPAFGADAGSSGFSFMSTAPPSAPNPAAAASTGFSFLSEPRPATDTTGGGGSDLLGGLNLSGPPTTLPAPSGPVSSGFSFLAPVPGANDGVAAADAPATGGLLGSVPGALPIASTTAAAVVIQPTANIKKKKGGFRPGFAREEPDAAPAAGGAPASGGSLLSGLVVHDDAATGEDAAEAAVPASAVPAGMLAGLRVHGGSDVTEDTIHTGAHDDDAAARKSSTIGAPALSSGGGVLAGMKVHASSPAASSTPDASSRGGDSATPGKQHGDAMGGRKPSSFGDALASAMEDTAAARANMVAVPAPAPAPAAVVASPAPKPSAASRASSPTVRKRAVLQELHDAARKHDAKLNDIKARLKTLLETDKQVAHNETMLRERLARVERQQDDAIRAEQFDTAESFNGTLEMMRAELTSLVSRRRVLIQERSMVEGEQDDAFNDSLSAATEAVMGLKRYLDDRETVLKSFRRDAASRAASASDKIATEEEQLRLKEEHVALDTKLVDEETQQVERAITDQTNELEAAVSSLKTHHTNLVAEVAELERLLEAKRREERITASQLADAESRIKQIRAKFEKQTKRLQVKRSQVEGEMAECQGEARSIEKERLELAAMRRRDRATEFGYSRQMQHCAVELQVVEALRNALLERMDSRRTLMRAVNAATSASTRISTEIDECARALRALASDKAALEAQASSLRATIASIDAKIPVLTEEKRAAVAEKKFKEAGRLTAELKRLSDQREETERQMSTALSSIDTADTSIASKEADIDAKRTALNEQEKSADLTRITALKDALRVIRRHTRRLGRLRKPINPPQDPEDSERNASADAREHDPAPAVLDIERDSNGRTPGQAAALALMAAEQRTLTEELSILALKRGSVADLGAETDSEPETPAAAASVVPPSPAPTPAPAPAPSPVPAAAATEHEPVETPLEPEPVVEAAPAPAPEDVEPEIDAEAVQESILAAMMATPDTFGATDMDADAAVSVAAPAPVMTEEEAAAARAAQLAQIARAVLSANSAIQEKEEVIGEAVGREDFDTADAAQADIDAFVEHRSSLLAQLAALGGTEADLEAYASGAAPVSTAASNTEVAASLTLLQAATADAGAVTATGFTFLAAATPSEAMPAEAAPVATGFSFLAPTAATTTEGALAETAGATEAALVSSGFTFSS